MSDAPRPGPEHFCTQCGQPEAQAMGDEILCASCCHERGSCGAVREEEAGKARAGTGFELRVDPPR
jgi:hypothetical protein